MISSKKIEVDGSIIYIEIINNSIYISLTDIVKRFNTSQPNFIIKKWLKNPYNIKFLYTWEKVHNPNIIPISLQVILDMVGNDHLTLSPKKWIELINAIGLYAKKESDDRIFAHQDIAYHFCCMLDPKFIIYFFKKLQQLKERESQPKSLEKYFSVIKDNLKNIPNLSSTIPTQNKDHNSIEDKD